MVALGLHSERAEAQGFLDQLFGGGSPPRPAYRPPQVYRIPPSYPQPYTPRSTLPWHTPYAQPAAPREREQERPLGSYRTLCVRTCDGYYFPISSSSRRQDFYRDADRCRSRCGDDALLFYQSRTNPDAKSMVDLRGRAYGSMKFAFRYRKKAVPDCSCKPAPWADEERMRHADYAFYETEQERLARKLAEYESALGMDGALPRAAFVPEPPADDREPEPKVSARDQDEPEAPGLHPDDELPPQPEPHKVARAPEEKPSTGAPERTDDPDARPATHVAPVRAAARPKAVSPRLRRMRERPPARHRVVVGPPARPVPRQLPPRPAPVANPYADWGGAAPRRAYPVRLPNGRVYYVYR
ncbi:MAG: DUF2865 domain-containing protein [Hyphomicrobiaceae bacterium]|nr:DUF2865 domain-containing protein [Hyphomicrobiaceae bacterium]